MRILQVIHVDVDVDRDCLIEVRFTAIQGRIFWDFSTDRFQWTSVVGDHRFETLYNAESMLITPIPPPTIRDRVGIS